MSFDITDISFRTPGIWGVGVGRNLTPGEADNNLYQLAQAILALQTGNTGAQANGIANINVNGTQMTMTLLDGTVMGPFTLPVLTFRWRDEWATSTDYAALDVVKVTTVGIFMVQISHTSDATAFDAGALDSNGNAIYLKLFGSVDAKLSSLSDVQLELADSTPDFPVEGDLLVYTGGLWRNTSHPNVGGFPFFSMSAFALTPGTLTTPTVFGGAFEYDGDAMYLAHTGGERGVVQSEAFTFQSTSAYTLTSQTGAQKLFNVPSNGRLSLGERAYLFECQFDLSSLSSSSGGFGFAFGGTATFDYLKWWSVANKATLATAAAPQSTMNLNSAANTAIVTPTTATVGWAKINGVLRVVGAGTLIPEVSLGVAAAAVVGRDSYFRIRPLGAHLVATVGPWD